MSDTNTISAALEGLRCRERELELEAVAVKARVEEIRDMIERLDPPRRRIGRPRKSNDDVAIIEMPQRVQSALAVAEADLPSLDDVRGILKPEDAA